MNFRHRISSRPVIPFLFPCTQVQFIFTDLNAVASMGFYTSGNDERLENTFDWTDNGLPYQSNYSNWRTGQPNNVGSDQDCLLLQYPDDDWTWGDVTCTEKHPFICEINKSF